MVVGKVEASRSSEDRPARSEAWLVRRGLIRVRAKVIGQRQIARIGRERLRAGEELDQEIARLARAAPSDPDPDEQKRRAEEDPGRPFVDPASGVPAPGPRMVSIPPPVELPPRERLSTESQKQQRKLIRLPVVGSHDRRVLLQSLRERDQEQRPKVWGDCRPAGLYLVPGAEPEVQAEDGPLRFWSEVDGCPWYGCRHHLGITVNDATGSIELLEGVDDGRGSCSLELAAQGARTLEEVGELDGVTRERVRQMEVLGVERWRRHALEAGVEPPGEDLPEE